MDRNHARQNIGQHQFLAEMTEAVQCERVHRHTTKKKTKNSSIQCTLNVLAKAEY